MRALTIHQPYASAILAGVKRVENRRWALKRPQWLALHAGRQVWRDPGVAVLWPEVPHRDALPLGAVLGAFEVVGVARAEELDAPDPWASGPWCWLIGEVIALPEPMPCRGRQGLWTVPGGVGEALRDAWRTRGDCG